MFVAFTPTGRTTLEASVMFVSVRPRVTVSALVNTPLRATVTSAALLPADSLMMSGESVSCSVGTRVVEFVVIALLFAMLDS